MNEVTEGIYEYITEDNAESFWKAFENRYKADNDGANVEFKQRLNSTRYMHKKIFVLSALYECYDISKEELLSDLHYGRLVAIFLDKFDY